MFLRSRYYSRLGFGDSRRRNWSLYLIISIHVLIQVLIDQARSLEKLVVIVGSFCRVNPCKIPTALKLKKRLTKDLLVANFAVSGGALSKVTLSRQVL